MASPVLLLGEGGLGKDVAARLIHKLSQRVHQMFLKVSCSGRAPDSLDSELSGHEAAGIMDANGPNPAKLDLCDKGTIFLDEIVELPARVQLKRIQLLDRQQFCRSGGESLVTVDVRILAGTSANLEQALAAKRLNEDLYHRLSVSTVHVPPLRGGVFEIPSSFLSEVLETNTGQQCIADPLEAAELLRSGFECVIRNGVD